MSFFCSRIPSSIPYYFSWFVSLGPLGRDSFSDFYSLWWSWQFWGVLIRHIVGCPFICLIFFSWIDFWGEGSQRWSIILITSYQGCILSTWFMTIDVDLDHLAEVVFVRFLHLSYSFLPPLSILTLWKEVTMHSPHFRSGELCSPFFKQSTYINYLEFFCMEDNYSIPVYRYSSVRIVNLHPHEKQLHQLE